MHNIAETIQKLRKQAGLSPSDLAERAEVSLPYVLKLEKGGYINIQLSTCKKLAQGLGITLKDLLTEFGYLNEDNIKNNTAMQVVQNAFRKDGYNQQQIEDIIRYARYVRQENEGGA